MTSRPLSQQRGHGPQMSLGRRVRAATAGARWARAALAEVRGNVDLDGLAVAVPPPPTVERGSLRGARVVLRLRRATCLERSLIVQRWWTAAGRPRDIVIGVRVDKPGLLQRATKAHAWVEGWDADCSNTFAEIRRVPAISPMKPSESVRPADD